MVQINVSSQDVKDSKSTGFAPIPAGEYTATVYEADEGEYKSPANKGKPNVNIQFKITGPDFKNRRLFQTVGLFPKWASGSNNFLFWQLLKALDVDYVEGEAFDFEPSDYLGTEVNLVIKIEDDSYALNKAVEGGDTKATQEDFKRNAIKAIKPFEEIDSDEADDDEDGFQIG